MKYNKEMVGKVVEQLAAGMSRLDTCKILQINSDTFYQWMKKPDFADTVIAAEFKTKQRCIVRIQKATGRDWKAAAWWLERKFYDEFGRKERHEVSGPGGRSVQLNGHGAVRVEALKNLDLETLRKLAARFGKSADEPSKPA